MSVFHAGLMMLFLSALLCGCAGSAGFTDQTARTAPHTPPPEQSLGEALLEKSPKAGETGGKAPVGQFDIHKRHGLGGWDTPSGKDQS